MKSLFILFPLLIGIVQTPKEAPQDKLLGSWTMIKYKHGQDVEYNDVLAFDYYIKNITPSHFSWCSYNPEDGEITGAGGGTYSVDSNKYIESTDFFYPSGTGIPGTETTFDYKIKGNMWTISGYVKEVEFIPGTGETAPVDSIFISEIWQRIGGI